MGKEKFVLVSLQEDKAKKLAQVITNDSCRRILDYLADKEATETDLAKNLKLPISTVHYNLKQLVDGGLVVVEEYHYSEKGKEVNHYKLANKYIIIAPKSTFGIKEKLKSLLPVALLIAAGGFALQFVTRLQKVPMTQSAKLATDSAMEAAGSQAFAEKAAVAASQSAPVAAQTAQQTLWTNITFWFVIGAVVSIILYLIVEKIRKK